VPGPQEQSPLDPASAPVERRVTDSLVDDSGLGKPLSARTRQRQRLLEDYLRAGGVPRYMQRSKEIDAKTRQVTERLARAHREVREACAENAELFARRWHAVARSWRFDELNELIREHNEWYPVEAQLPMDPRTRDYVRIRGRSYRRRELDAEWVLERFAPTP